MQISFSLKLGILITTLTTLVSSIGIANFYFDSKALVREGIQNRLLNIGMVSSSHFTDQDRQSIKALGQKIIDSSPGLDESVTKLRSAQCNDVDIVIDKCPTISGELRSHLEQQGEYQRLIDVMRKVVSGSSIDVGAPEKINMSGVDALTDSNYMAYLQVPLPQAPNYDVSLVLANNDEASDPLGNLYAGDPELFATPFETGKPVVSQDWYFDEFCVERPCMSAVVPVLGDAGEVIAILGLDYQLDAEWGAIARLERKCYTLVSIIVVVSIVLSLGLAAMVNVPIRRLVNGARAMQTREVNRKIKTGTRDEFGYLAAILNEMWREISDYSNGLEKIVAQRTSELESVTDSVNKLNEKLAKENKSLGSELDIARDLQLLVCPTTDQCHGVKGFDLAVDSQICPEVAGNYVDIINNDEGSVVAIGDISEQGLETELLLLNVRSIVRSTLVSEPSLSYSINHANQIAVEYLDTTKSDKFMALSLLSLSKQGEVHLAGQHEDVLIVRESGRVEIVDSVGLGFPLGLLADISPYTSSLGIKLKGKDTLVLFTNGVTEARNDSGDVFGLDRLTELVSKQLQNTVEDIKKCYQESMKQFLDGTVLDNDQSLILIRRH